MEKPLGDVAPIHSIETDRAISSSLDRPSEKDVSTGALGLTYDEQKASNCDASSSMQQQQKEPVAVERKPLDEGLDSRRKVIIVLALCLCVFLSALDQTISGNSQDISFRGVTTKHLRADTVTTAIPAIAERFQSPATYTWIGCSYLLTSAAFLPSWGKFSDIWGRKPVLLSACFIFLIGSILCAAAQNIGMLLVGRVIQGLGAGGQLGLVNVIISDLIAVRERGVYLSYIGLTWAFASAIGPVLGGAFTQMKTWRLCFWINLPIGVVAVSGLMLFLHLESPRVTLAEGLQRVDWLGTLLIVSGTVLFLLGLEFGGVSHPWDSPIVLCFIIIGLLLLAAFIYAEWKMAKFPIIPLRLFIHRTNACSYLVGLLHGMIFIAGCYFIPLYFQAARGYSALLSGVYVLPYVIVLSLVSAMTGVIIAITGRYQEVIWAGTAMMALGVGLFINIDRTSTWGKLIMYQVIAGIGCGPLFQSPLIAIHSTIDHGDVGTATTTFSFIRTIGTALSICIGLVVFQNEMQKQSAGLSRYLSPEAVNAISGSSAAASIGYVQHLPEGERAIAMGAYSKGLSSMWYFYMAMSILSVITSIGIGRHHLSKKVNSLQPAKVPPNMEDTGQKEV